MADDVLFGEVNELDALEAREGIASGTTRILTIATESAAKPGARLKAVAIAYPRCSNHNDLDPLRLHPEVDFNWIGPGDTVRIGERLF